MNKNRYKIDRLLIVFLLLLFSILYSKDQDIIAICNFKTNDKSIENLGWKIAELMRNKISDIENLNVIERDQIDKVISEQRIQLQDYSNNDELIKFGNILGAKKIVIGSIFMTGTVLNVTSRLVDVESGVVVKSVLIEGKYLSEIPNICDIITFKLFDIPFNEDDFQRDIIQATGQGFPPKDVNDPNKSKMMAKRAAIIDAKRNLLEEIKGIQIFSNTTIENYIISNDTIRTKVNGIINNVDIVNISYKPDGSAIVILEIDKRKLIDNLQLKDNNQ